VGSPLLRAVGEERVMCVATLVISGREWVWPISIFMAVALVSLGWTYRRTPAGGLICGVCLLFKGLGLVVLAACLLNPLWSGQRARPGANLFVVLAEIGRASGRERVWGWV